MKVRRTTVAVFASVAALSLSALTGAHPAAANYPVTNILRDNPGGTVPIIHVTTSVLLAPCSPLGLLTCSPQTSVTINLNSNDPNYPPVGGSGGNLAGATVYVHWLRGPLPADGIPAGAGPTDCSRTGDLDPGARTLLGTATFSAAPAASASLTVSLPPNPTGTSPTWLYGVNWICATTAQTGGTGGIGDTPFIVSPA